MLKKLYRKPLCFALVLVLSIGLFAGCTSSGTPTTASSAAPASSAAAGSTADSGDTASGERVTLRVEVFDRANQGGSDPTNNAWTKWINDQMIERHNIAVEFVSVPRSEEIQQLNVMMAGGDAPDIVFTYTQSVVYNYYKQGGTADLTDYIEQFGPTIKSYLGEDVLSYGQFDGRQHMIPAKRISRAVNGVYMRKDWLDAVSLPVPTTREQFYDALVAFKEKNPGNVEQVIPMAGASDVLEAHFSVLLDSFVDPSMTDEQKFVNWVDGSSILMYPGVKEGVQFLNKMYNAGLIDPQFPLYKDFAPSDDLISRGLVGAFCANYDYPIRTTPGVYNNLKKNVPGAELVPVDTFPNSAGETVKRSYLPTGIYNFVPASSKNIEAAVKYLDFLCDEEVRTYITCGEEGVNHTKDADGIPVIINLQNDDRMMNSPNNLDYAVIVNGVDLGDPDLNVKVLSKSYEEGYDEIFIEAYNIGVKNSVVFSPLIVPFEAEAQFAANLKEKVKEILAAAITTSEANFNSVYDNGIQEWLAAGGQQILDDRQAYWDANHK